IRPSLSGTFKSDRIKTRLPTRASDLASADSVLTVDINFCSEAFAGVKRAGYPARIKFGTCQPCLKAYLAAINATVVSSMRLEKPHALSHQDDTVTSGTDTLVRPASTVLDAASWV